MSLVVSNEGEELFLSLILEIGYTLRLFTNDVTAGLTQSEIDELVEGDFTEATFAGYAASAITGGTWTLVQDNPSVATNTQRSFTRSSTGTAELVRGYYYTFTGFGGLIWFEEFLAPISVEFEDDEIQITPRITLDDSGGNAVQPGIITGFGGAIAPTGWLLCQGQAVSRTSFAPLFAAIGTSYGSGDGATTFNVPDLQQKFPLGKAASGTGATLGAIGGAIDHVHGLDTPSSGARVLISTVTPELRIQRKSVGSYNSTHAAAVADTTNVDATSSGTALTGDTDTENPPFQVLNFIIKA